MKKYLMTGIAAVAMCAAFTSCSNHDIEQFTEEELQQQEIQKIKLNYEQAFINTFGQPAANQDWGFGAANTRTANTEHNQWAAVDNIYKLLVPPALTPGQIQRVKAYFQNNRFLTYEDPQMTNFFVQQVYKGSPATAGTLSSEQYKEGNGTPVIGSNHMDKLTVGVAEQHVNNFNNGDCGEAQVLNNGTVQNNYVPNGTTHTDKITLMLNETTEYVGFYETESSLQHNDCCALAAADVIDAWADSEEAKALGIDLGESVVDGWNRSFVGLDYEQKPIESVYVKHWSNVEQKDEDYAHVWDFCNDLNNTKKVMYNNELVDASTIANDILYFPNGKEVRWIDDNTNSFLGENLGTNQNDFNKQSNGEKYYDLDAVYSYINQGAYPKNNNMEFIKNIGGRDYVFSDWIVTLTPANTFTPQTQTQTTTADLRIIAEDLSVGDGDEDFDFNDVVFDVYYGNAGEAKAVIQAAGGTLDLRVDGKEVHALFGSEYAGKMINTNGSQSADANVRAKSVDGLEPVEITLTKEVLNPAQARDNIKVEVNKNGQWVELEAVTGKVASKVRVGTDYQWVSERTYVGDGFKAYVLGEAAYNEWYKINQ